VIARIAAVARELPEVTVHGPTDAAARMPTLALSWGRRPASDVAEALGRRGVIVSGGRQCAPLAHATLGTAEAGVVRLSAGPQTTLAEADLVCEALASFTAERGD
jgi:selenocysteine lyase/cysteine desulfurase